MRKEVFLNNIPIFSANSTVSPNHIFTSSVHFVTVFSVHISICRNYISCSVISRNYIFCLSHDVSFLFFFSFVCKLCHNCMFVPVSISGNYICGLCHISKLYFIFMLVYIIITCSFCARMFVNSVFSHYISSIFILISVHEYAIFNFTVINYYVCLFASQWNNFSDELPSEQHPSTIITITLLNIHKTVCSFLSFSRLNYSGFCFLCYDTMVI